MHGDIEVPKGATVQEIVRTSGRPEDVGGNDRQIDLAWAAGFFDGEGHIAIHRSRQYGKRQPSYSLQIMVAQVDKSLCPRLQSILGGKVTRYAMKQGGNRAPFKWVWRVHGQTASQALSDMLPYLVGKREQAEVGIELQSRKRTKTIPRKALTPDEAMWQKSQADKLLDIRSRIKSNN